MAPRSQYKWLVSILSAAHINTGESRHTCYKSKQQKNKHLPTLTILDAYQEW